jgi:carboxyl-terminal processing protease
VDSSLGGLVANGDKYTLSGEVDDLNGLLDMYVLVNDQKVYFQAVDAAVAAKNNEPHKLKFSTEFSLKEGNNSVLVVARESTEFASRRTLVIRRRPAELAQKLAAPATATKPATKSATP